MNRIYMVGNPARGQLKREIQWNFPLLREMFFPSLRSRPDNLVSRDEFGRPVPHQPTTFLHSA